jgi:ABC-type glutathione transport system ATPase component
MDEKTREQREMWRLRSEYSSLTLEINQRRKRLDVLSQKIGKRHLPSEEDSTLQKLEERLSHLQNLSLLSNNKITSLQEKIIELTRRESYDRELERLTKLEEEKIRLESEVERFEEELGGALEVEETVREAKVLATLETIEAINQHAKTYLDVMFDDPISVRLQGYRKTAKGEHRNQMSTSVFADGHESRFEKLCGGESQKCELAFLLAVNDLLQGRIILLDEALPGLDQDVNIETINYLKEFCGSKLIIVTAQRAVEGIFENVVSLTR